MGTYRTISGKKYICYPVIPLGINLLPSRYSDVIMSYKHREEEETKLFFFFFFFTFIWCQGHWYGSNLGHRQACNARSSSALVDMTSEVHVHACTIKFCLINNHHQKHKLIVLSREFFYHPKKLSTKRKYCHWILAYNVYYHVLHLCSDWRIRINTLKESTNWKVPL